MSPQLFEVLSLSARYLFALLAIWIVFRTFVGILSDRQETQRTLHRLPNAGFVGELIVISGDRGLNAGLAIPVPWEGVLGSVRSCDLWVPASGIQRKHLFFSFQPGLGLLIHPFSGCEARVNRSLLTVRTSPEKDPVTHGSFLQVGNALLRFRAFAGLTPDAGFEPAAFPAEGDGSWVDPAARSEPAIPSAGDGSWAAPDAGVPFPIPASSDFSAEARIPSEDCPPEGIYPLPFDMNAGDPFPTDGSALPEAPASPESSGPSSVPPVRRRRRGRWEGDWSE